MGGSAPLFPSPPSPPIHAPTAAAHELVKGFAVGRTIFGDVARGWFKGETDDTAAVGEMARRYTRLCEIWDAARAAAKGN